MKNKIAFVGLLLSLILVLNGCVDKSQKKFYQAFGIRDSVMNEDEKEDEKLIIPPTLTKEEFENLKRSHATKI